MDKNILENILIGNKSGKAEIISEHIEYRGDETIIRILFTLTGTVEDNTFLKSLSKLHFFILQMGYASIGVLENPGINLKQHNKGELFLLPPYYQKYLKFEKNLSVYTRFPFMRKVQAYQDNAKLLFLPILCAGLYVCELIADYESKSILFVGENMLSTIVKRILEEKYMIQPVKCYKTASDIERDQDNPIATSEREPDDLIVFLFESTDELLDKLDQHKIEYFDLTDRIGSHWFSQSRQEEAMQILPELHELLSQLVSAHVHAEDIDNIIKGIENKRYGGKTIVFDW